MNSTEETVQDRAVPSAVKRLITELVHRFGRKRIDLLTARSSSRAELSSGAVDFRA